MAEHILTLPPEEVARFLLRHRRHETLERYEPRLDDFLREILAKANEFVPSESGAIFLDDPRVKLLGSRGTLTCITAFGERAADHLGRSFPCDVGVLGEVYNTVRSVSSVGEASDGVRSLLAVPVVVGASVCGVLELVNRLAPGEFTDENRSLIEIFAGYISSSVQNALDAMRAREAARRDHLTGLFNERYFNYRLREEIRRAQVDSEADVALLFIDLDAFKQINDRFGHLVGSQTLHEVGLSLASALPPSAIAARYGGDEFVVIVPGHDARRAFELGELLRGRIARTEFLDEAPDHRLTVSIGVASLRADVDASSTLVKVTNALVRAADAAMYRAKSSGKNRVVGAETGEEESK